MGNMGANAPTWAGVIVAGSVLFLVGVSILFRGNVHF